MTCSSVLAWGHSYHAWAKNRKSRLFVTISYRRNDLLVYTVKALLLTETALRAALAKLTSGRDQKVSQQWSQQLFPLRMITNHGQTWTRAQSNQNQDFLVPVVYFAQNVHVGHLATADWKQVGSGDNTVSDFWLLPASMRRACQLQHVSLHRHFFSVL